MRDVDIAWAAGLLEGEGSFTTKGRNHTAIRVHCHMTDRDILERLQELFGGHIYPIKKRETHWKDAWAWCLSSEEDAARCMELIRPHMGSRRGEKIDELLAIRKAKQSARESRTKVKVQLAEEYLSGKGSLRALAKKHGVSYNMVWLAVQEFKLS